ncbi:hypothetical protein CAPTEDRAFT_203502 [Capitella teleta]|uniref:G-protein coupled receptors family 1 profile domain-containing protein n=1 Tax=Capitella teleta TaxID=283909 RepID=R7V6G0_CAPTE|nr:hypothetical protein CAPTEDRAFT_203502 [Capitella teleta]|eukprot:ELU14149.1 hypothetical protein CAPTEDRAFT_203502 [Capitella teleta]
MPLLLSLFRHAYDSVLCIIIGSIQQVHFAYLLILAMPTVFLLGVYGHLFVFSRLRVQPSANKASKRAVRSARMLLITAVLFIVSWAPTMSLYYEFFLNQARFNAGPGRMLFQTSSLLIFGHSIMNPITYTIMSSSFRANARESLFFWCPGFKPGIEPTVVDSKEASNAAVIGQSGK